ncbi:MAG: hypothetical protein EAZ84_00060, partial [Verrucomicrobia bacterium]
IPKKVGLDRRAGRLSPPRANRKSTRQGTASSNAVEFGPPGNQSSTAKIRQHAIERISLDATTCPAILRAPR